MGGRRQGIETGRGEVMTWVREKVITRDVEIKKGQEGEKKKNQVGVDGQGWVGGEIAIFFLAKDGLRVPLWSRGVGGVYKKQENISIKSLEGVVLFYPDPWPKRKHHKRRIVQEGFLDLINSSLILSSKKIWTWPRIP